MYGMGWRRHGPSKINKEDKGVECIYIYMLRQESVYEEEKIVRMLHC